MATSDLIPSKGGNPDALTVCSTRLFDSREELEADLPAVMVEKVIRVREAYSHWLDFPAKPENEIVQWLMHEHGIKKSAAYDDMRVVAQLLGKINVHSRDFHRWRFYEMFQDSYKMAKSKCDVAAMAKLQANYIKAFQLDQDDVVENDWNRIKVQPFVMTTDPTVLGLKPIPNIQEKIRKMREKYWTEDVEAVEVNPAEFNEDDIFGQKDETNGKPL